MPLDEEIIRSESIFRTFIETIDDIVLVGDREGSILYANPAATAKLGYPMDALRGTKILDLHPEYLRKEATEILTEMFAGRREACPLPLIAEDGRLVPVETRVWFGDWDGEPCIFGVSKDLSREQEALQKFDRFFHMNPALMAVTSLPDRRFTEVNEAFLETLGYERDEILGRTTRELGLTMELAEQDRAARMLDEFGKIRDVEMTVRTRSGETRHGLFSGEVIESQGRSYHLTVMIDITDRVLAEEERKRSILELRGALDEVKTLRGIVPICTHCKKIRDDKGYWEQVESYVTTHTEARFSHGICPECMEDRYPEYSEDDG